MGQEICEMKLTDERLAEIIQHKSDYAAKYSDVISALLELQERRKREGELLEALKACVALAGVAFDYWDSDQDSKVGKILRYLSDPKLSGYRPDIDAIHAAIVRAEAIRQEEAKS